MIAVDTSALMAIVLGEAQSEACIAVLEAEKDILSSAATRAEALIVSERRDVGEEVTKLIDGLGFETVDAGSSDFTETCNVANERAATRSCPERKRDVSRTG